MSVAVKTTNLNGLAPIPDSPALPITFQQFGFIHWPWISNELNRRIRYVVNFIRIYIYDAGGSEFRTVRSEPGTVTGDACCYLWPMPMCPLVLMALELRLTHLLVQVNQLRQLELEGMLLPLYRGVIGELIQNKLVKQVHFSPVP